MSAQQSFAYKIVQRSMWEEQQPAFSGTPLDLQDGFIHLSAQAQVKETAEKWCRGQAGLVLVCVDLGKVESPVKWEPSRNNELFPHVYGKINASAVVWIEPLPLTEDGNSFVFPKALGI